MADSSQVNSIAHQLATQPTKDNNTVGRRCITPLLSRISAVKQDFENLKQRHGEWEEEFSDFVSERASLTTDLTDHYRIISSTATSARSTISHLGASLNAIERQVMSMESAGKQSHHSNVTAVSWDRTPRGEVACEVPLPASSVGWDELAERQHLDLAEDGSNHTLADEDGRSEAATQAELSRDPEQEQPPGPSNNLIASIVQGIPPPSESYAASADPRVDDAPHGSAGRATSIVVVPVGIAPTYFLTPPFWDGFPPQIFTGASWVRSTSPDIERRQQDIGTVISMVASWREGVVPGDH